LFYLILNGLNAAYWNLLALLFAAFLGAVSFYLDQKKRRAYFQALQNELVEEEAYLKEGKLSRKPFNYQSSADHPYGRDLNLFGDQSLHQHLNRSLGNSGAKALSHMLEANKPDGIELKQAFIQDIIPDRERNFHLRALAFNLGKEGDLEEKLSTWAKQEIKAFPVFYWPLMILGSAFSFYRFWELTLSFTAQNFQFLIYALTFNLLLLLSRMKVFRRQQAILSQLSDRMKAYAEVFKSLEAATYQSKMGKEFLSRLRFGNKMASGEIKRLSTYLAALDQMANAVVLVLINGFVPYHLLQLRSLGKWHKSYAHFLPKCLHDLAQWEAYMSIANYCDVHQDYCWPRLSENPSFKASELGHPLIGPDQRVSNVISYHEEKFIILTGSNMSGKSTFLRTVGLNLVLTQIGAKVCAQSLETYPFQILASMSPSDNIHENKSYFQAEVIRLKMLIDRMDPQRWSMLILDEILRGTNSDDKKEGTRRFMLGLKNRPAFGLLATHDVDIAVLAEDAPEFSAYFFESRVEGEELIFDYKLRSGVCRTPNANLLMKNYGLFDDAE